MKKIILLLFMMGLLCGCRTQESKYLVSSIGFDYNDQEYEVCFETIVVNSEKTDQQLKLFQGKGESIEKAVGEIEKQCTRPLVLSHCGVIAVSQNLSYDDFLKVCDFCYKREEITLSAFFIKTNSPLGLLSTKPLASVCVGYDIMGLLKQNKPFGNRFFEIIKNNYKVELPTIKAKTGGIIFGD